MYLADLLSPALISLGDRAPDKWTLLDTMIERLVTHLQSAGRLDRDFETIREATVAREKERATGIGRGCALPHARISGLRGPAASLTILAQPVDFDSPDKIPVRIVCLLLAPDDGPTIALKIMAELAGLLTDTGAREFLEGAESPDAVYEYIRQHESGGERAVTARMIMRKPLFDIHPDTPLTTVTRLMQQHNVDAVGVEEVDGTLIGEITCDTLCQLGMPDFFGQLRSVAFIKKYDPFENYFKELKNAVAGDVMSRDFAALPENATLLEVIFELSVQRHAKVHVVRDGKRVGVIDRNAVISRVINF